MEHSINKPLNSSVEVDRGCIAIRFDTLIAINREMPYDWYKSLHLDKSLASKIRRGIIIPKKELRILIAGYFKCDSETIWPVDYKKWCEMNDAVEDMWDKIGGIKNDN